MNTEQTLVSYSLTEMVIKMKISVPYAMKLTNDKINYIIEMIPNELVNHL